MIAQLRGTIIELNSEKDTLRVVLDVHGVGYEVFMAKSTEGRLHAGQTATLLISESVTAFDGATTLYGFATREEKDFYDRIRANVDGMGPKKAIECLDKISKSMPDFKRAVIDGDMGLLVSIFGFTKKTAEKLVFALKGQVQTWSVPGAPKWSEGPKTTAEAEAVYGLLNLGYREEEARGVIQKAKAQLGIKANTEELLQEALRIMGARLS